MHCSRCGHRNDDGDRFCSSCGAELKRADEPAGEGGDRPGFLRRVVGTSRRERWISAATGAAIVIAIVAFLLLDTPKDDDRPDPFVVASDERCLEAKGEIAAATDVLDRGGAGARAAYAEKLFDIVEAWRADQRALEPPASLEDEARAYSNGLLGVSAALADLASAATSEQGAATTSAARAADEATAALEIEIDELGLERCGALAFEPDSGS